MLLDLTDKSQVVAAGRSLPCGVIVTDIEAKAERPSETIFFQGVLQGLAPAKAGHGTGSFPSPLTLHFNVITSCPIFGSPPPRLIADPAQ